MGMPRNAGLGVFVVMLLGLGACGGGGGTTPPQPPPVAIAFSHGPTSVAPGGTFDATVSFLNAAGTRVLVDGEQVIVTLENNVGGATLGGQTVSSSTQGLAYFFNSLTLNQPGLGYTLRATSGSLTTVSPPFDIVSPAPTQLAFSPLAPSVTAGAPFAVNVELRNALGMLVSSATNSVTLTLEVDGAASARLLHASGLGNPVLEYLDPTDASTLQTLLSHSNEMTCLLHDPAAGLVYGSDISGNYFSFDPVTGAETPLGSGDQLHGMAWDESGVLPRILAISRDGGDLYEFDPGAGTATSLGAIAGAGSGFTALAAEPGTGVLYAVSKGMGRSLVTIDPNTLTRTVIAPVADSIADLTFHPDGTLFAITGDGASTSESLYVVNVATAAMTFVGTAGNGDDGEAIGFVAVTSAFSGGGPVAASGGIATFPFVLLDMPGTGFRLRASSPGLPDVISPLFDVLP